MSDEITVLPDDKHVAFAIRSLIAGEADEHAQKAAMNWIINDLCGTYKMTFHRDNQKLQDFSEGTRHVGRTLVNISNTDLGVLFPEQVITETGSAKPSVNKRRRGK